MITSLDLAVNGEACALVRGQSAEFFDPARAHPQACDAGIRVTTAELTPAMFQRARMERALGLLPHHSVTETASLLGYSNVSHCSAAFCKQFGVLPRTARRGALE